MIDKMSLVRSNVHILNVCKCRPPENRKPEPDEVEACLPYLKMQLAVIKPSVIVCLGASATEALLGPGEGITKRRGNWEILDIEHNRYTVMPTLHPSYLLRNREAMKDVAKDLSAVLEKLREYDKI
jgi:DNA polymerase